MNVYFDNMLSRGYGRRFNYPFLTSKERDNETGLDYFLARYYSSAEGRFTSPDEFTGGPDELYYFVDDASANPTFYADLRNPQSLNKYQYTYNNPVNLTDDDGHCPACVVVVVVVTIEILAAPDTVNAPTGLPGEVIDPAGDRITKLFTNVAIGAGVGGMIQKAAGPIVSKAAAKEAKEVVEGAAQQSVQRGSRNPNVAKTAAEGRARHAELAKQAKPSQAANPNHL